MAAMTFVVSYLLNGIIHEAATKSITEAQKWVAAIAAKKYPVSLSIGNILLKLGNIECLEDTSWVKSYTQQALRDIKNGKRLLPISPLAVLAAGKLEGTVSARWNDACCEWQKCPNDKLYVGIVESEALGGKLAKTTYVVLPGTTYGWYKGQLKKDAALNEIDPFEGDLFDYFEQALPMYPCFAIPEKHPGESTSHAIQRLLGHREGDSFVANE